MAFKQQPEHELDRLSDEALIAYIRDATSAGKPEAARRALGILVFGYQRTVRMRVSMRVPRHAVEDVSDEVLVRAIASAFDGSSVGQFRSWLGTIADRTAVDWYRRRERRPEETALPEEHAGEEDGWPDPLGREGEAGAVELRMVLDGEIDKLSEKHRQVVELHVFGALPAAEVCRRVDGMNEDNVAQIASRFRKGLREALVAEPTEDAA